MSFHLIAIGTKVEVIRQLGQQAEGAYVKGGEGETVARHLIGLIGNDDVPAHRDYDLMYVVKASGHQGPGGPMSLNVTIEGHRVPADPADVETPDPADSISGDSDPAVTLA
jgi:hypothetical protein